MINETILTIPHSQFKAGFCLKQKYSNGIINKNNEITKNYENNIIPFKKPE